MANQITASGLELYTVNELITIYTDGMKAIYGPDINLDQDTPDGQQMMLIIQMLIDQNDLLREIYNSFDPDNAIGVTLDKRISFNGIQRLDGTYTLTNITIVSDRALTLAGLNSASEDDAYRIADDAGTEWLLLSDEVFATSGTQIASFRALNTGATLTTLNTITTPVSIILGVSSVNNPAIYTTLGIDEESDNDVKIRRGKAVSRASQGYLPSLRAELENINEVGSVVTYENVTGATDANGVPEHSIWVIVSGTATPAQVAEAIYKKRSSGCNMYGTQSYLYTEVDGKIFEVKWDNVIAEDLYIEMTVESLDGINPPLDALIVSELPNIYSAEIGQSMNINELVEKVREIDPNSLVSLEGLSLAGGGPFIALRAPTTLGHQLQVTSPNITVTVV